MRCLEDTWRKIDNELPQSDHKRPFDHQKCLGIPMDLLIHQTGRGPEFLRFHRSLPSRCFELRGFLLGYSNRVKAETDRLNNHELDDLKMDEEEIYNRKLESGLYSLQVRNFFIGGSGQSYMILDCIFHEKINLDESENSTKAAAKSDKSTQVIKWSTDYLQVYKRITLSIKS
ncbi:hypothetical protein AgCh_035300 [Apium graveolens]